MQNLNNWLWGANLWPIWRYRLGLPNVPNFRTIKYVIDLAVGCLHTHTHKYCLGGEKENGTRSALWPVSSS